MSGWSSPAVCRCPTPDKAIRPSGMVICNRCGAVLAMTAPPKRPKP